MYISSFCSIFQFTQLINVISTGFNYFSINLFQRLIRPSLLLINHIWTFSPRLSSQFTVETWHTYYETPSRLIRRSSGMYRAIYIHAYAIKWRDQMKLHTVTANILAIHDSRATFRYMNAYNVSMAVVILLHLLLTRETNKASPARITRGIHHRWTVSNKL